MHDDSLFYFIYHATFYIISLDKIPSPTFNFPS